MSRPVYKKSYGQHHLIHGALCRPLVDFLAPAGQRVLEIGPGGGVLTAELAAAEARVLALEVDLPWAFYVADRVPAARVAALDALTFRWDLLRGPTLVAGNLPFNVGTRLIEGLLPHADRIPRAGFMVQKEVAERLVAQPGDSAYGSLSVWARAHAEVFWLGRVKAQSFRPPPKVDAAFVGLILRKPPYRGEDRVAFQKLIRLAFAQRRKTLRNTLGSGWGKERAGEILAAAGIDPRRRAETLDLAAFEALFEASRRHLRAGLRLDRDHGKC